MDDSNLFTRRYLLTGTLVGSAMNISHQVSSHTAGSDSMQQWNDKTISLIDRYITAWNARDDGSLVAELFIDGGIYQDMSNHQLKTQIIGHQNIKDFVSRQFQAFPDLTLQVITRGSGHVEFEYQGTNTGPFTFIDPEVVTGKRLRIQTVHVLDITANDELAAVREYYDGADLLRQLGLP